MKTRATGVRAGRPRRYGAAVIAALLACLPALAAEPTPPALASLPEIADVKGSDAPGTWDNINLDTTTHRAFIGRNDGVSVIDLQSERLLPVAMPGQHVHTALPLPDGRLLVTNGRTGTATVIDQASGAVRRTVTGLSNPDAAIIEPATGDVLIVEAGNGEIALVDAQSGHLVSRIAVGGQLEQVQADGTGRVWVNVRDQDQLALVDLHAQRVVGRFPLAGCEQPTGLASIAVANRLVVACWNGVVKVLAGADGKDLGTIPVGMHADGVILAAEQAWIPAADGTLSEIGLLPTPHLIARYATRPGAPTGAFDPFSRRFYLPYGATTGEGAARALVAGSFGVLVLQGK